MSFLVPVDLSTPSLAAIELAAWIGRATSEEAVLLHVTSGPPSLELLAALYELAAPLRAVGVTARLRTIQGNVPQRIAEEAFRRNSRWIIMGTRGKTGPESVAQGVMAISQHPVLAVKPGLNTESLKGVTLWAPARSLSLHAWDVASLLSSTFGRGPVHRPNYDRCSADTVACANDVLLVVDVGNQESLVKCQQRISQERCAVVLVSNPAMEQKAQQAV